MFGCIPKGVAFARIAPLLGWKLTISSKGRASPDTAQARDFALSIGQTMRIRTVGSEAKY